MKYNNLLLFVSLICINLTFSQKISNDIISNQGNESISTDQDLVLDWTLGEPWSETLTFRDFIYSEGFQQPYLIMDESFNAEIFATIYPNPTSSLIHIRMPDHKDQEMTFLIFTTNGQLVDQKKGFLFNKEIDLNVQNLESGVYMLKVLQNNNNAGTIHKIIKY